MKTRAWTLGTVLLVPIAAVAQSGNPQAAHSASGLSHKDRLFLHAIASEDQSEIDLAKLALQKSADPQIQQYARTRILAADPDMEKGAKDLAVQNHAVISSKPNAAAAQQYSDFSKLSGNDFDRAYVKYEYRQQAADLKIVKQEADAADNPQVRSYAQREETPVKQAAQSAQNLAQAMHVSKVS